MLKAGVHGATGLYPWLRREPWPTFAMWLPHALGRGHTPTSQRAGRLFQARRLSLPGRMACLALWLFSPGGAESSMTADGIGLPTEEALKLADDLRLDSVRTCI